LKKELEIKIGDFVVLEGKVKKMKEQKEDMKFKE